MIYTREKLGDPIESIRDLDVDVGLEEHGFEIVSGADYDVLVTPQVNEATGVLVQTESSILGRLYLHGAARGVRVGQYVLNLDWYPSPTACNDLSEQLDREPGVDVMRFVHASHDKILKHHYEEHITQGEYPQSTGRNYFIHDRNYDHAIGVLLAPTELVDCIKEPKNFKHRTHAEYFDAGTSVIGKMFRALSENTHFQNPYNFELFYVEELLQTPPIRKGIPRTSDHSPIFELMRANYAELVPKIEKLQAGIPPLTT